jgi:hypothetical protein
MTLRDRSIIHSTSSGRNALRAKQNVETSKSHKQTKPYRICPLQDSSHKIDLIWKEQHILIIKNATSLCRRFVTPFILIALTHHLHQDYDRQYNKINGIQK